MDSTREITNLLYRYVEYMDAGRLDDAASLFRWARIKTMSDADLDSKGLRAVWEKHVQMYPCGTPRTKHLVTNALVEINEGGNKATARSYYTVMQCLDDFPLQIIAAGRYHDEFERVDGLWRFSYRDYSMMDMVGDMSRHLKNWG
ncbi:MAG TPA: nuclear transport factor 2 family protein [Spongiibacteraceae bacterium]|nr:nuclear transport factor 2 family protein [Spongiibacteraceae bacterium]